MVQEESQDNPASAPNDAAAENPSAVSQLERSLRDCSVLKKYTLWVLRLPATVGLLAKQYLSIAALKTRLQCVRHFSLSAAFHSLGRAAYVKQAAAHTLATQYAEIKAAETKLDEMRKPTTADGNNSTRAKISLKFKNLLRRLQTIPLARRVNRLLVSLGKSVSTDEAVGAQFFNEWNNLKAVRAKMAALKDRKKAIAEFVPSQTDFSWWPSTITGCVMLFLLLGLILWNAEQKFFGAALVFFVGSGLRYLWFSATTTNDLHAKLRWWRTPGVVSAIMFAIIAVVASNSFKTSKSSSTNPAIPATTSDTQDKAKVNTSRNGRGITSITILESLSGCTFGVAPPAKWPDALIALNKDNTCFMVIRGPRDKIIFFEMTMILVPEEEAAGVSAMAMFQTVLPVVCELESGLWVLDKLRAAMSDAEDFEPPTRTFGAFTVHTKSTKGLGVGYDTLSGKRLNSAKAMVFVLTVTMAK